MVIEQTEVEQYNYSAFKGGEIGFPGIPFPIASRFFSA